MESEWTELTLTDLYEIRSGLSKPAKYFGSGYPFLAFKDVMSNYFVPDTLSQLVQSSEKEQENCSIKRRDVFLTRTSETMNELGTSCVALKDYPRATFNGFTKRLRPKDGNKLVPEYVGYYLRSPQFRNEMLAFSTMSTRASLNNGMISHLRISFPSTSEQEAIGWILKSLDDKIELNRQMNVTLEAMAQALFKSWFVNFDPVIDKALAAGCPIPDPLRERAEVRRALGDRRKPLPAAMQQHFPSRFVFNDEMGWIPEGWEAGIVKDVLERLKIRKRYKKNDVENFGAVPVYEQGAGILSGYHNNKAEIAASVEDPAFIFGDHTCVTKLSVEPFSISENVIALRGKGISTYWVYYAIRDKQRFEEYRRHWMELIIKPLVISPSEVARSFGKLIAGNVEKQAHLSRMNTELSRLRDTLLPQLLSGELRIPDAEKLLQGAL